MPVDRLFSRLPAVAVTGPQARRFCNGGGLSLERTALAGSRQPGLRVRVYCSADSGAADSGAADSGAAGSGAVNSGPEPGNAFLGLGEVDAAGEQIGVCKLFRTAVPR